MPATILSTNTAPLSTVPQPTNRCYPTPPDPHGPVYPGLPECIPAQCQVSILAKRGHSPIYPLPPEFMIGASPHGRGRKRHSPTVNLGHAHPRNEARRTDMGLRTPAACTRPLRGQNNAERRTSVVFHRFPPNAERLGSGGWTLTQLPPQPRHLDAINVPSLK